MCAKKKRLVLFCESCHKLAESFDTLFDTVRNGPTVAVISIGTQNAMLDSNNSVRIFHDGTVPSNRDTRKGKFPITGNTEFALYFQGERRDSLNTDFPVFRIFFLLCH